MQARKLSGTIVIRSKDSTPKAEIELPQGIARETIDMTHFCDISHFRFFDATTIAIMLPVLLLAWKVIAQALRKGFLTPSILQCNQTPNSEFNLSAEGNARSSENRIRHSGLKLLGTQLFICMICMALASAVTTYSLIYGNYDQYSSGETFREYLRHALNPMLLALVYCLVCTIPIFLLLQVFHIKRNDALCLTNGQLKAHLFVSSSFFATLLLWLVPLLQTFLAFSGLLNGDLDLLKNFFRIGVAMSVIPLAMGGIALACYKANKTEAGAAT